MSVPAWLKAMRPEQWSKNALVGAAWFFAKGDHTQTLPEHAALRAGTAIFFFCLMSSAVYLMNDLKDRELDRKHPRKRNRPIASGKVTGQQAILLATLLAALALGGALLIAPALSLVLAGYLILQVAYTFWLKTIPLVDVIVLASGFVLRAYAGAVVIPVPASPWLMLCTFLLAFFLALCKRRHEKSVLSLQEDEARPSLRGIDGKTLDRFIDVIIALNILTYALYSLAPESVEKFGDHRMVLTLPWVVYGLLRYRRQVRKHQKGGQPEKQLFCDPQMILSYLGYLITLWMIFQ
ncbi:MAG: UbiA prenyltransferase family protein [Verrucomicrobia bacterium]|nr:UbiA prenyltransferase family protein [Verrucomicrobiota bacterium]MCH8511454.1 UbiA prenyltransferase family protein [Kiritimatiellia bacterium]